MAKFKTPIKENASITFNDKITIPSSPFLNRLGYGTGVNVMELVRSPHVGQICSPSSTRVKPSGLFIHRLVVAEANLLRRMSHPNIVGFRAFGNGMVLYSGIEACDLSLGNMIEKRIANGSEIFLPREILKVATDIAGALDYVHTKMYILHGDIKSYNILVRGDFVICKLWDFGATLQLNEDGVVEQGNSRRSGYMGTEAWSAPEVIHDGQLSDKTDIWSLGLTFWEMMALMPPTYSSEDDSSEQISVLPYDDLNKSIDEYLSTIYGKRPKIPMNVSEEVYVHPLALFYCCTETTASMRPSAHHLAIAAHDMLEQCLEDNNVLTKTLDIV